LFTSRAEYRLALRHDTADFKLLPLGHRIGLQGDRALERLEAKRRGVEEIKHLLAAGSLQERDCPDGGPLARHVGHTLEQALRDPQIRIEDLAACRPELAACRRQWLRLAELDVKYAGYIQRQERQVERFKRMEELKIPASFDYGRVAGLSAEARGKLAGIRPLSLGQASRIAGVRSSDLAVLMVYLRKGGA
jgi:tRNA uridine 5-carboxymethylaminomethyl modification enzyme